MGIDKTTTPNYINVVIQPKNIKYLEDLKTRAEEDGQNAEKKKGEPKSLSVTLDKHSYEPSEYYFDEGFDKENVPSIQISGEAKGENGEYWFSIDMPLTDTVLLDILAHSIKRLNKLKTAIEVLK